MRGGRPCEHSVTCSKRTQRACYRIGRIVYAGVTCDELISRKLSIDSYSPLNRLAEGVRR